MILYHYTHRYALGSILWRGLLAGVASGCRKGVWLATHSRRRWARLHVARHHRLPPASLIVLAVNVPAGWLERRRRGVWVCSRDIPTSRIMGYAR